MITATDPSAICQQMLVKTMLCCSSLLLKLKSPHSLSYLSKPDESADRQKYLAAFMTKQVFKSLNLLTVNCLENLLFTPNVTQM